MPETKAVNYEERNIKRSHLSSAIPICGNKVVFMFLEVEQECIFILNLFTVITMCQKNQTTKMSVYKLMTLFFIIIM